MNEETPERDRPAFANDAAVIAEQLHDLRLRVRDMAADNDDEVGRWLVHVASEIEDIEFAVVLLSERQHEAAGGTEDETP